MLGPEAPLRRDIFRRCGPAVGRDYRFNITPSPTPPKLGMGRKKNPCKSLEMKKNLLYVINTVKAVLQQSSYYVDHGQNSFESISFIS